MLTYQDLLAVGENEAERAEFVRMAIREHQNGELFRTAKIADDYDRCRNTTTMQYQKMITDITGRQHADTTATVHRSTSNYFGIFTSQLNQYLLGNGVMWAGNAGDKLGEDFDTRLQQAGKSALCGGVSFGFFNLDHLEVFSVLEFAPLYDEENGALAAGIRFWRIDPSKPMRATLYEMDGLTHYLWTKDGARKIGEKWMPVRNDTFIIPKVPYKITIAGTEADGTVIYAGENYPAFPIIPLWGNQHHQSELVGMREKIDAYDFILNGWENDLDNAQIYWLIKGAGGMDDPDLARFLERLRNVNAAAPEDGQEVDPVTVSIPVEAREKLLERLEKQLYKDAMILNPADIAGGAATATQIRAAYEPQNIKADQFEYCVLDFLDGIKRVAGIKDKATFQRSTVINRREEVETVVISASYLTNEYITRKVLDILGDGDKAEEILKQLDEEAIKRLGSITDVTDDEA